jgi:predicted MPP superfamily phosphohydrolase
MRFPISRRAFLYTAGGAVAAGFGALGYATSIEPEWLELVEVPLALPDLPDDWQGKTVLHLSDLHAGDRVSSSYLLRVFARARDLKPDLVVYTGDFIDIDPSRLEEITGILAELPLGGIGTFGVLGNHDYGAGWSQYDLASELRAILAARGIRILGNTSADLSGLVIAGCDDLWARRCRTEEALRAHRDGAALLALAHNPDIADQSAWQGKRGVILSGHTHGGQCRAPFLPPFVLPVKNKRYAAGFYDLEPGRAVYINRGIGHLTKVRFNVRPEMTLFTLVG